MRLCRKRGAKVKEQPLETTATRAGLGPNSFVDRLAAKIPPTVHPIGMPRAKAPGNGDRLLRDPPRCTPISVTWAKAPGNGINSTERSPQQRTNRHEVGKGSYYGGSSTQRTPQHRTRGTDRAKASGNFRKSLEGPPSNAPEVQRGQRHLRKTNTTTWRAQQSRKSPGRSLNI